MACEICGETEGMHNPRCPKYEPLKFIAICEVCGQGIYEGDEYIEIKELFGIYETGNEYYVDIDDIEITAQFSESKPSFAKQEAKYNYYLKTGELPAPIVLKRDFTLVDGYISYLICQSYGINRVPVYFEE